MTRLFLSSLVVLLSFQSLAQWPYNRLDRIKQKSPERCLAVSKKYIKVFPERSAPYYFVSVVYFETVDSAANLRGKYVRMGNALLYARKFEALEDEEMKTKVNWEDMVAQIEEKVADLSLELNEQEMFDLSDNLYAKLARLDQIESIELIADNGMKVEADKAAIPITSRNSGQYYGLPSGRENIRSHSLTAEKEMLAMINQERKSQGMGELEFVEDMARACRYQAFDMGSQAYFDHDSYDRDSRGNLVEVGETFYRIRRFYNETFSNAENIAAGNEGADETYLQWYNSKGHYENMFNPEAKKVGIGVVHVPDSPFLYYWVLCTAY